MIRSLKLTGFKSLDDAGLKLGAVNLLIGPNAAGKSNVVRSFRFLADAVRSDVESATAPLGGIEGAVFWGAQDARAEILLEYFVPDPSAPTSRADMRYRVVLGAVEGRAAVLEEELLVKWKRTERGKARVWLRAGLGKGHAVKDPMTAEEEEFNTGDAGVLALKAVGFLDKFPRVRALRTFIESWQFLSVNLDAVRAPRRDARADHLEPDASNLVNVLRTLRGTPTYDAIIEDVRVLLDMVEGVDTSVEKGRVILMLKERPFDDPVEALSASDGTLRLLALLTALHLMPEHGLLCVEEIEHGLHPHVFGPLLDIVRQRCPAEGARQIVVTTHSPDLLDAAQTNEVVVVDRTDGRTTLSRLRDKDLARWRKEFRLGELWRMRQFGGV